MNGITSIGSLLAIGVPFVPHSPDTGIFWTFEAILHSGVCQKVMSADDGMGHVTITSGVRCLMIMFSKVGIARMRLVIFATLPAPDSSYRRIPTGTSGTKMVFTLVSS